ncbi:hypothetical protein NCCP133_26930 [Cytobacillus sp. NCCP-133]|nr:hypothetical protein NCCP133_26930 [Cytobacillus sp. NCCP-133]
MHQPASNKAGGIASVINNKTDNSTTIMYEYGSFTKKDIISSTKIREDIIPLYN